MSDSYSEIIIDSAGNTYVGAVAQPFAYGKLKLPAIFAIDDACFHVFEVNGEKVIHRASQSTRALAQNYMTPDRVCVYRRYEFEHTHEGLGVDCKYCGSTHYPVGCRRYRKADGTWENVP